MKEEACISSGRRPWICNFTFLHFTTHQETDSSAVTGSCFGVLASICTTDSPFKEAGGD